MSEIERPAFVKDKHLQYLDGLRESGVTNMYGASPYVQAAFRMSTDKARATLIYWMKTFETRLCQSSDSKVDLKAGVIPQNKVS